MKYKLGEKHPNLDLYRVVALKDFGGVKEGDIGGWVESEKNLSQEGNCWVYDSACVYGDACVYGNARVYGNAMVYGNARVYGNAWVYGDARVCGETVCTNKAYTIDLDKDPITATDNHIQIGCELHTYEYWMENYRQIGEKNDYTEGQIEAYGLVIKALYITNKK